MLRKIALCALFSIGWLMSLLFIGLEFGDEIGGIYAGLSIMALAVWLGRRRST